LLTVYKRVEKSTNFLTGIENKCEGLDFDRPFLFSIGENGQNSFELLQKSLNISRIQNKDDNTNLFRLDAFHADFLSLAYEKNDNEKDIVSELVTKYFLPYLMAKGNDIESLKKQARKMNFLVFSTAGHKIFSDVEKALAEALKNNGLSDDDINDIFFQISLSCLGASINHYNNKVNSIYFVDVNDKKTAGKIEYLKQRLEQEEQNNAFGGLGRNLLFIFDGNGQNSIENYFNREGHCFGGLAYVTSYLLDNSISEKLPITSNGLCNLFRNGKEKDNYSIDLLDRSLTYSGAKKHTDDSIRLRNELDEACDQIMAQSQPKSLDDSINYLLSEIRLRCSDIVYYQICAKLGLIKNPSDEVMNRKTDRDILIGIQELMGMIPAEYNSNKVMYKKEGE